MIVADAPNWAEISTGIGSLGAAVFLGLTLAAVFVQARSAVQELKEGKRFREAQVLAELGRRWDSAEFIEVRRETSVDPEIIEREAAKWDSPQRDESRLLDLLRVPNFFEDLALIIQQGSLDVDLVTRAYPVTTFWRYWQPTIDKLRDDRGPTLYSEFERLSDEIKGLGPEEHVRRLERQHERSG